MLTYEQVATHVIRELHNGYYVNPRVGIPTLVADHVPDGMDVMLQSENGLLGMGPLPTEDKIDADMINAGKQTVTARKGVAIFDSVQSFAMIRGSHVDLMVPSVFEAGINDNIVSQMIPGKMVKNMGGVMDLIAGADNTVVVTTHASRSGESKLLPACILPLIGVACIKRVFTDLVLLEITDGAFTLRERIPGVSVDEIVIRTAGKLIIPETAPEVHFS